MGFACPVCETPQSDREHLANHLAFTAMLGDDGHESWLDEHAPGWEAEGEAELAERLDDHVKEVGFPQVFDDTSGQHDHGHDHGDRFEDELARANTRGRSGTPSDADARQILQEAREMTESMLDDEDADGESEDETK